MILEKNDITTDQFNIEYMGFLTGEVDCTQQELINFLNEYLKTSHL